MFDIFKDQLCIIRDVTGSCFEGVVGEVTSGLMPQILIKNCRQINYQDATKTPLECEWWHVGDQVFHLHHIVGIHLTNLAKR